MASILSALLLCLFLQHASAHSHTPCMIENAMMGGSFNIMIYPKYLMPNEKYNVTVNGTATNVMVALSASYNGSSIGNWTGNANTCQGILGTRNLSFTEMWMSPESMMDAHNYILFKVFIKMSDNMTYVMNKTLKSAPTSSSTPTMKTPTPDRMTPTPYNMTTTPYNMTTTPRNMPTTTYAMTRTTGNSASAITFKSLNGIISTFLLFVTVRELLS
ncbi:uncharacterized protein LOC132829654 [Hemiscyllium ocellatum]|uniref:uncharacterized protein LOC132829654 n=1 Tax=Hemiscyllium ocellatum TaxID=170820 RepID=UPI002966F4C8|nr:uncharacterized protein LOC132829654 [Hemiscyllium ocellatum]